MEVRLTQNTYMVFEPTHLFTNIQDALTEATRILLDKLSSEAAHWYNKKTKKVELKCLEKPTPYDINCGYCNDFCHLVCDMMGGETKDLYGLWVEEFTNYRLKYGISHVIIFYNDKYYDAECHEGVRNWKNIPLCKKAIDEVSKKP
jgi:hypothetical protein